MTIFHSSPSQDWSHMVSLTNRLQYLSKVDFEARERLELLEGEAEDRRREAMDREEVQHA